MIYGPFLSRRLGYSLGIDLLPPIKTCTFNCVYCEIGKTPNLGFVSISHKEVVSKAEFNLLQSYITNNLPSMLYLNSITIGYNGEPTLVENLKDVILFIRDIQSKIKTDIPISIFSNSSTICDENIRRTLLLLDNIYLKIDAALQDIFIDINRPHNSVKNIDMIIDCIKKFREEINNYQGNLVMEQIRKPKLIIQSLLFKSKNGKAAHNFTKENIIKLAEIYKRIKPDKIHLYTIARTPAEDYVIHLDLKELIDIKNEMINFAPELLNLIDVFG